MPTATNRTDPVPTDLIVTFRRDGYVVVPDVLTSAELAALAPAITRAVTSSWPGAHEGHNLWERAPDVRDLASHPSIAATAAALIGSDALRLWSDHACFDEPGSGAVDAHRDQDRWPITEARTITAWVPLDAAAEGGAGDDPSCRGYVPGSHRAGLRHLLGTRGDGPDDVLTDLDDDRDATTKALFAAVPAGAVAFHHGLTVHLVRANDGTRVRRAHAITYFADGCTRGPGPGHDSVDRTGIARGALIDGPITPLVWTRPSSGPDPRL